MRLKKTPSVFDLIESEKLTVLANYEKIIQSKPTTNPAFSSHQ